ncbi:MAG: YbaY family lipoprotein [Anaerolineae bacterium]|nr:YbaY family lipoprotein [Anaerolineae bacterium]
MQADCNRLNWTYKLDGTALTFNTLGATTLALCQEGSLDRQFLQLLGDTVAYVEADGKLILNLKMDAGNMVFKRENAETVVTGSIVSAESAVLPEDAIIQVQIQDTSQADAPATVIGEQIMEAAGAQFPIGFKVAYNPSDVDQRFTYSMGVRITDASGKLIFVSDTVVPVITNGHPTSDVTINVVSVGQQEVNQPAITITSPQSGETLDGPYIASGTGTGLFEGNVVVRLLDGNGDLMAEQATTLQGENVGTGGFGTWQVQFDNIYGQPQSNGTIEASDPETVTEALFEYGGLCYLHFVDGDVLLVKPKPDANRLDALNRLTTTYIDAGHIDRTQNRELLQLAHDYDDMIALVVFPTFTVAQVIQVAQAGRRLPAGITRFIVPDRILRVNLDIDLLQADLPLRQKNRQLHEYLAEKQRRGDIRHYDESLYLLDE